jgi:hypothetical protein
MEATKPYEFIGFGAIAITKPHKFIGFGAIAMTKPYKFIGFGAIAAADMTTRCAFKIEDPSRGPGRVDFRALDLASRGPRNLRSRGTPPQQKGNLLCGPSL